MLHSASVSVTGHCAEVGTLDSFAQLDLTEIAVVLGVSAQRVDQLAYSTTASASALWPIV
jgi:hypothetical protein